MKLKKRLLSASGPARAGQRDGDGKAGRRCAVYIDDLLAEILMGRVQAWVVAQRRRLVLHQKPFAWRSIDITVQFRPSATGFPWIELGMRTACGVCYACYIF